MAVSYKIVSKKIMNYFEVDALISCIFFSLYDFENDFRLFNRICLFLKICAW